jgi:hypothetical protein
MFNVSPHFINSVYTFLYKFLVFIFIRIITVSPSDSALRFSLFKLRRSHYVAEGTALYAGGGRPAGNCNRRCQLHPLPEPLHPFSLSVDIAGDQPDLSAADFLEKHATLTVWQGTVPQRYLHGIITGMQAGENNDWQMNYHLTLSSPLWRCGLRQNFRIFQQQDIQTISSTLLAENGVTDWVPSFMNPIRRGSSAYSTGDRPRLSDPPLGRRGHFLLRLAPSDRVRPDAGAL